MCEPARSKRMSKFHKQLYTEIYRKNAAAQNHGADFVRACAVEARVKISQEPLIYTEIYRKNAAAKNHGVDFVRACAVEARVKISQEPLIYLHGNLQKKCRSPKPRPTLCAGLRSRNAYQDFIKSHFIRKLTGKMPQPRVSTLIQHRPLLLP